MQGEKKKNIISAILLPHCLFYCTMQPSAVERRSEIIFGPFVSRKSAFNHCLAKRERYISKYSSIVILVRHLAANKNSDSRTSQRNIRHSQHIDLTFSTIKYQAIIFHLFSNRQLEPWPDFFVLNLNGKTMMITAIGITIQSRDWRT